MTSTLVRNTSLFGALIIGLGSILGTGAYVSISMTTNMIGLWIIPAILIAAITALCNGLSSSQLAAVHPVSGGTYEYGYRFLNPTAGYVAGSLFVIAKSASAATAALAVGSLITHALSLSDAMTKPLAGLLLFIFTILVTLGVKRTNLVNSVLVAVSIVGLAAFMFASYSVTSQQSSPLPAAAAFSVYELLQGAALMFVAFTGYGRIATMGEEIQNPRKTIPRVVVITLVVITGLYLGIAAALLPLVNVGALTTADYNLASIISQSPLFMIVSIGAVCAMSGVVLNLILGVSRVVLAMGRRGDLPVRLATLNKANTSAPYATWVTFAVMIALTQLGDIVMTWSVSAFTVLVYYGLTNVAALKVDDEQRFIPSWISIIGLVSCCALAFFVPVGVLIAGVILLLVLALLHRVRTRVNANTAD